MRSEQVKKPTDRQVHLRAALALGIVIFCFIILAVYMPEGAYLWIKALHIVAVMSWMAALLYLPRLFVNHVGLVEGSAESVLLQGMEGRLLRIIMTPAMILSWIAGLWLSWVGFQFHGGWLHGKFLFVIALTAVHWFLARSVRQFADDSNGRSARFWRAMNELPALLMIGIVILVVVKPF